MRDRRTASAYRAGLRSGARNEYIGWIRRFILFHRKRHPRDMGEAEVQAFLDDLAVRCGVSPSTQSQALNALAFLYRQVLGRPLGPALGVVAVSGKR